jgi:hypothetical protein
MSRVLQILIVACLMVAGTVEAQSPPVIEPGKWIRITRTSPRFPSLEGHLNSWEQDSIRITTASGAVTVGAPTVAHVYASDGKKSNAAKGAAIGLAAGGLAGIVFFSRMEYCVFTCEPIGPAAGAVLGAVPGLLIGVIAGAVTKSDRWRQVR